MSEFMTVIDRLCHSEVAKYGAELNSKDPIKKHAAKMYHALADLRALGQGALPDEVYASLDKAVREVIEDFNINN